MKAFRSLINVILSPPALILRQLGLKNTVDTDVSAYGLGFSLHQTTPDGERQAIAYCSQPLALAERDYSVPEREFFAVDSALKTLHPYLLFETFIVGTDHAVLRRLLAVQEPYSRLVRWRQRLPEYNFKVMSKKSPQNVHADALSRLQTVAETSTDDRDEIPSLLLNKQFSEHTEIHHVSNSGMPPKLRYKHTRRDIQQQRDDNAAWDSTCLDHMAPDELFATLPVLTSSDPMLESISRKEMATAPFQDALHMDICLLLNERLGLPFSDNQDGILSRHVTQDQIVIPHTLKQHVLHIHHYARSTGHPGGEKLNQSIRTDTHWPALAVDCYATARQCPTYAKNCIQPRENAQQ